MKYATEVLKNRIPLDVLETIKPIVQHDILNVNQEYVVTSTHGNYYMLSDQVSDIIKSYLPLLPNENPSIRFLIHTTPTGPHTDTNVSPGDTHSDPKRFARTFIVPLETQNTKTITFNECLPEGSVGGDAPQYIAQLPARHRIDKTFLEEHLNWSMDNLKHMYSKLSIETIFEWNAGDILIFDRSRLHTGDNHLNNNVNKQGFVVWSEIC